MPVEEDESPALAEQEPCEPEDQFDEDLMWYLSNDPGPNQHRQPSQPQ
jgi:hypothetical protein